MTRFIVRVDDVGQAPEQHKPDRFLEYFTRWWDAGGWGGEPIYLGVVPADLTTFELEQLYELEATTKAELCIHGWDHANAPLSIEHIDLAAVLLPRARCVIPPYNRYDVWTIAGVAGLHPGGGVLFGGMHEQNERGREADHSFGPEPHLVGLNQRVLHLSAEWALTKHSYQLVDVVRDFPDPGYPVVITLHHRWDVDFFTGVRQLREALEGRMVPVEEAGPNGSQWWAS